MFLVSLLVVFVLAPLAMIALGTGGSAAFRRAILFGVFPGLLLVFALFRFLREARGGE